MNLGLNYSEEMAKTGRRIIKLGARLTKQEKEKESKNEIDFYELKLKI